MNDREAESELNGRAKEKMRGIQQKNNIEDCFAHQANECPLNCSKTHVKTSNRIAFCKTIITIANQTHRCTLYTHAHIRAYNDGSARARERHFISFELNLSPSTVQYVSYLLPRSGMCVFSARIHLMLNCDRLCLSAKDAHFFLRIGIIETDTMMITTRKITTRNLYSIRSVMSSRWVCLLCAIKWISSHTYAVLGFFLRNHHDTFNPKQCDWRKRHGWVCAPTATHN